MQEMFNAGEDFDEPRPGWMWCDECKGFGEVFWGPSDNLRHQLCPDCKGLGIVEDPNYEPLEEGEEE